ncbi:anhydro-N-acetylmuramic acid kinase [Picosynechococcus sp. PCC 11901]|uniref:anhydro-N-acetylmuramic acid kinase n=1 Tax=Picosynechococcus sp. PCC 11901 TaxID=2579791 RepID=UPI0010FC2493|nr:anhydro-N-acetylmuramic acid kinase [Picosynechococcus sp. PCC 11901]QCS50816.1 anhydro-N-acetylmuramic acid kinase [Picosynechococcus sp. PCC 11901]
MRVIGLMSGTSVDGIDAALVEIQGEADAIEIELLGFTTYSYPSELREKILAVCAGEKLSALEFAALDDEIAHSFATAAIQLQERYSKAELIGSHGQTIFHRPPNGNLGLSWQLGRGEAIAQQTNLPTVSNFRRADLAAGGQGAPLVPKVDAYLLADSTKHRCIQNLGGIGNVTYLPPKNQADWENYVIGWDTGPGNVLLDLAIQKLTNGAQAYDQDGIWASQGTPHVDLVQRWLGDPFVEQLPPKSTGREYFGIAFLEKCWQDAQEFQLTEADWLASLTEFTALTVQRNYELFLPQLPDEIFLCGGGCRNSYLKKRLQVAFGNQIPVRSTDELGLNHDAKEAIAFAVLAYWRMKEFPGNLPKVTGAKCPALLGEIHLPY